MKIWMRLILCLFCLVIPTIVLAAPFLVCDPQAGVDYYHIYQDGVQIGADILAQPDGSLHYDLSAIAPGAYDWTAEACNVWGCEITPNPYVSPGAMSPPQNLRLAE